MLNCLTVQGRMTKDPELRSTTSGTLVCAFCIACDRDFKGKDGNKETDFIECVAYKTTAEHISKFFKKGQEIIIKGRLQVRTWDDKDGNKRKTTECIVDSSFFCGKKGETASPVGFVDVIVDDGDLPF